MDKVVFDRTQLEEWRGIDPDNWRPMVSSLIELFLKQSQAHHQNLEQAWGLRNLRRVSELAHTLKSSCGSVGAKRAQQLLHEIEDAAQRKDAVAVSRGVKELDRVFADSVIALIKFRESLF